MSRCSHFKLDLSVLIFRRNSLFSSMYTVDRDYDQFFKGKSSLNRNLILVNLLIFTRLNNDPRHGFTRGFTSPFRVQNDTPAVNRTCERFCACDSHACLSH